MRHRKGTGPINADTPKRIAELRAEGMPFRKVAKTLGISLSSVQRIQKHPELVAATRKPAPRFEMVSVQPVPDASGRSYELFPPKRRSA